MLSHHIIREDQEPALVIDTAEAANFELIQQLLEWSPTVIVTEPALKQVLVWGIKIDVVVAVAEHLESISESVQHQFPVKIISCLNKTEMLETALYFLTASKQKTTSVISDLPLEEFEKFTGLEIAVIKNGMRWVLVRHGRFEKWLPAHTGIAEYPDASGNAIISTAQDGIFTLHRSHSFWICETN